MIFKTVKESPFIQSGQIPQRVISLVPSQTELLIDLGLEDKLVGRTKFCIHPEQAISRIAVVGGTKRQHVEKIKSLNPDLIIANKEENTREEMEQLAEIVPIYLTDITSVEDTISLIDALGLIFHLKEQSAFLQSTLIDAYNDVKGIFRKENIRAAYLIWENPIMVAANNTYINSMLRWVGIDNAFEHLSRYPELSIDEVIKAHPTHVFLSSEPFPFREKHMNYYTNHLKHSNVILIDGEQFSWYGTRILKGNHYFDRLFNSIQLIK